jgi:hypothetical protein
VTAVNGTPAGGGTLAQYASGASYTAAGGLASLPMENGIITDGCTHRDRPALFNQYSDGDDSGGDSAGGKLREPIERVRHAADILVPVYGYGRCIDSYQRLGVDHSEHDLDD